MNEILNEEEGTFGRVVLIKKMKGDEKYNQITFYKVNHYINEVKISYGPYNTYDLAQSIFDILKEKQI